MTIEGKPLKERERWIDIAKFVGIIAVIMNHTVGIVSNSIKYEVLSYFCTSLLIILSGITLYQSNERERLKNNNSWVKITIKRIQKIVVPYLVANFIYYIVIFKKFDFDAWLVYCIHFNISGPFYYVALYIQLLIACPFIYCLIKGIYKKKNHWFYYIILTLGIIYLCYLTTNYTNIDNIYGGGGKLFGGNYLFQFYLGMYLGKFLPLVKKFDMKSNSFKCFSILITATVYILWMQYYFTNRNLIDSKLPFGEGFNPPGVSLTFMALLVMILIFTTVRTMESSQKRFILKSLDVIGEGGRASLYIFLYHRLFLDFLLPYMTINNSVLKGIVYFGIMIFGSVLMQYIEKNLVMFWNRVRIQ